MPKTERGKPISEFKFPGFTATASAPTASRSRAAMHSFVVVFPDEPVTPILSAAGSLRRCSRASACSAPRGESTSTRQELPVFPEASNAALASSAREARANTQAAPEAQASRMNA